jgi:hypothetical protein
MWTTRHASLRIQNVSLFRVAKLRKQKCLVPAKPGYTVAPVWSRPGCSCLDPVDCGGRVLFDSVWLVGQFVQHSL